ncbi:MAG TPA: substrate-binding domain-containing protein [Terriglobia bacterium]|nr:substrate-binding domain-containing protein [Terriglobia bacterium]
MKMGRGRWAVAGVLVAGSVFASCGKAPHQDEHYIFVAANIQLSYWQEARAGFMDAVRQLGFGVKADFVGPEAFSPNDELDAFEKAAATHPTGIIVAPVDAKLFKGAIDEAVQDGTPVICIDSDAPDSKRLMFIGTDNYRAGTAAAKKLADALKGEGYVIIITIPGQLNLEERRRAAMDVFAGYPKIKVIQTIDDKGDPRQANDQISAMLDAKKEFDGVLALEASGGPGAAEAFHRLNLDGKVPVVAMDKDPETLDFISTGAVVSSIAQKPYTMAFYGLRFLDDLHHNVVHQFTNWRTAPASPLPTLVDTGFGIVDTSDLAAFQAAAATYTHQPGQLGP